MRRTALLGFITLGLLPLTGCGLFSVFGGGCTDQNIAVPDGTPNVQHYAGTYTLDASSATGPITLDLTAKLVDTDHYDVTGSATFQSTNYSVEGEVLAGGCEAFVAQQLGPQTSPIQRTLALRLTEPAASEPAYTIAAMGNTTATPAYLATGAVSFSYAAGWTPPLAAVTVGSLDFTPLPY